MEKSGHETGSRQLVLKKSFKTAVLSLLTACSRQVIVNLHQTLEDEFDAQCQEFQVGPILDNVEQLVEEQSLDPLFSDKTNVMDLANDLTIAKKSEIQKLTGLLQRAEEQKRQMEARISLLREQPQEASGTASAIEKLKTGISGYFEGNDKLPPILFQDNCNGKVFNFQSLHISLLAFLSIIVSQDSQLVATCVNH